MNVRSQTLGSGFAGPHVEGAADTATLGSQDACTARDAQSALVGMLTNQRQQHSHINCARVWAKRQFLKPSP